MPVGVERRRPHRCHHYCPSIRGNSDAGYRNARGVVGMAQLRAGNRDGGTGRSWD